MEGHEKNRSRRQKIQKSLYEVTFLLELLVAAFVVCLILYFLVQLFLNFVREPDQWGFMHFLELSLDIVIGIEFLKMLCRHNINSVVEVLLFALARHMIVEDTSMLENLLCVTGAALLFVVRKYLFVPEIDRDRFKVRSPKAQPSAEQAVSPSQEAAAAQTERGDSAKQASPVQGAFQADGIPKSPNNHSTGTGASA